MTITHERSHPSEHTHIAVDFANGRAMDNGGFTMILRRHFPSPPLDRYVQFFWYYEGWEGDHSMERVLPDGTFELIINLRPGSRRLFNKRFPTEYTEFRRGWISGPHSEYILIDAVAGASMIGAHFYPGGMAPFIPASASELRDKVVEFDDIWGSAALILRDQLFEAAGPGAKFTILDRFLNAQLKRSRAGAPVQNRISWLIDQLNHEPQVKGVSGLATQLGVSHKHFIQLFREQVGLTPKLFCRIQRFQNALAQVNSGQPMNWAELADACGYYDQAHFNNDFQAFAGLTPSNYKCMSPDYASFVAVEGGR